MIHQLPTIIITNLDLYLYLYQLISYTFFSGLDLEEVEEIFFLSNLVVLVVRNIILIIFKGRHMMCFLHYVKIILLKYIITRYFKDLMFLAKASIDYFESNISIRHKM